MTSALRGEGGTFKSRHSNQPSKGGYVFLWTRGKGVKKSENFADVIYGSPLTKSVKVVKVASCVQALHSAQSTNSQRQKDKELENRGKLLCTQS